MTVSTKFEALALIDQKLDDAILTALSNHAVFLLERGATADEVNSSLATYRADLAAWRTTTRLKLERVVDEPWAPSHEMH